MDEVQTLRAHPPHNGKQLLYFRMKHRLMITVPTHKCHKSSFKHSKTSYVFTSGRVIFTVQIHRRKELLKGLKWPLQNGPLIPQNSRISVIVLQDLMKWNVCQRGVEMLWVAQDTTLFQTGQERNMTTFDGHVWTVVFNSSSLHIVEYFMFMGEGEK